MPAQASWVELWLERYCAPGHHRFAPARAGVVRCQACNKEELLDGATCLICGIPGERHFLLLAASEIYTGKLCGPCQDEFLDRGEIRGWTVQRAG